MRKFWYSTAKACGQAVKGGVIFTAITFVVGLASSAIYDAMSSKKEESINNKNNK